MPNDLFGAHERPRRSRLPPLAPATSRSILRDSTSTSAEDDAKLVAEFDAPARPFADQRHRRGIESEVVVAEIRYVQQTLDEDPIEFDEHAEVGDRNDRAVERLADELRRVLALQPVRDAAADFVGAPLRQRQVFADFIERLLRRSRSPRSTPAIARCTTRSA